MGQMWRVDKIDAAETPEFLRLKAAEFQELAGKAKSPAVADEARKMAELLLGRAMLLEQRSDKPNRRDILHGNVFQFENDRAD